MDISKLTHGIKLVLGASIAFLVFSFPSWFKIGGIGIASGWSGIGFVAGLLAIAIIAWEGSRLANITIKTGVSPSIITAALSLLLLLFAIIRFIDKPGSGLVGSAVDRTFWAWLGLLFAIGVAAGAFLNMKAAGEGLADMKTQLGAAAGSASAAAKGAVEKDDAAPAAPAAPPAEAPPASPDMPAAPEAPAEPSAPAADEPKQTS